MEIQDDTEALRQHFMALDDTLGEVESVHRAELDAGAAMALMADPKGAIKAMGIPVSDESRVDVTMKNRADRSAVLAPATNLAARVARIVRVIIIVIHYRNCDSDIIIVATRN